MMHQRSNGGRGVHAEWHEFRDEARRTAFSAEEFSEIDQERYDLDTAGITGEDNPETYQGDGALIETALTAEGDLRDQDGR